MTFDEHSCFSFRFQRARLCSFRICQRPPTTLRRPAVDMTSPNQCASMIGQKKQIQNEGGRIRRPTSRYLLASAIRSSRGSSGLAAASRPLVLAAGRFLSKRDNTTTTFRHRSSMYLNRLFYDAFQGPRDKWHVHSSLSACLSRLTRSTQSSSRQPSSVASSLPFALTCFMSWLNSPRIS
jgi:hypothetical protein